MKNVKRISIIAACFVIVCVAVSGTLAWLIAETGELKNTFVSTDIEIDVEESDEDGIFDMVPGWNITKDPIVTVTEGSEDCWVFVKLEKSANYDDFLVHAVDSAWTQGNGTDIPADVYYLKVTDENGLKGQPLSVLCAGEMVFGSVTYTWGANELLVRPDVTKNMMNSLTEDTYPTLTVSSKAVQLMKSADTEFTAAEAWAIAD